MRRAAWILAAVAATLAAWAMLLLSARRPPARAAELGIPSDTEVRLKAWNRVGDFEEPIAQFETVFWEPEDTLSLRQLIRDTELVRGKRVLEIGTGSGLIALACLRRGAARVVATDVNPAAIANAAYNAEVLGVRERLEVRYLRPERSAAFQAVGREERFDLIVSNPPWEDDEPSRIDDYALYDPDFRLLHSLLAGARDHLEPGGEMLLAYGAVTAVREVLRLAPDYGFQVVVLDQRPLEELPETFLPGMLLRLSAAPSGGVRRSAATPAARSDTSSTSANSTSP